MTLRFHRSTRRLAASLTALLVLIGCGSNKAAQTTDATSSDTATEQGPVTLTLLAHDSFTPTEGIFDDFMAETGITVRVVRGGDAGSLVTKAVVTSGNPEGDVLWGVDNTLLSRVLEADVFSPYVTVHRDDLDADAVALSPDGHLTPVDSGDVCINYDVQWFKDEGLTPPGTLESLTNKAYANRIVVPSPLTSSPGLAFLMATIAEFGEGGVPVGIEVGGPRVAAGVGAQLVEREVEGGHHVYCRSWLVGADDSAGSLVLAAAALWLERS